MFKVIITQGGCRMKCKLIEVLNKDNTKAEKWDFLIGQEFLINDEFSQVGNYLVAINSKEGKMLKTSCIRSIEKVNDLVTFTTKNSIYKFQEVRE
jgi:hypothetical protein